MAAEAVPTPRPAAAPALDKSAWMDRRAQAASGDAFAQVFANIEVTHPDRQKAARDPKADNSANDQPPPRTRAWHEHKLSKSDRAENKQDKAQDDNQTADADNSTAPRPKTEAKKAEKPQKTDDAQQTAESDACDESACTAQAAVKDTQDTQSILPDAVDVTADQSDQQPVDTFKLALGIATANTQNADACEETANENNGKEQAAVADDTTLEGLLSFRANSGTGVPAPGKKPAAAPVDGLKTGFAPEMKTQAEKAAEAISPFAPTIKKAAGADLSVAVDAKDDDSDAADLSSVISHWAEIRKDAPAKPAATNEKTDAAASDPNVLTAPPAAGSRANALTGFPAPAPTDSGGGSPSHTAKAAVTAVEGTNGMNLLQGNASASLENTNHLQLVRAPRGMANLPPAEQVGITITRMVRAGVDRFDLELHPADLGKVDIRIEIKDGLVRATVTADNQGAYDMLQKDSRSLERLLEQAGLKTDSGSLSFNLREDGQAQKHADLSDTPWKRWPEKAPMAEAAAEVSAYTVAPGRVDLRI